MLTASGSPLVVGAQPMATQAHRKIRVNRPFIYEGRRREIGEEFTVPTMLYAELVTAAKCELAENAPSEDHMRAKAEAQAKAKAAKAVPA
jgi:hypothetical protein